jgi:hypothetical protein
MLILEENSDSDKSVRQTQKKNSSLEFMSKSS